MLNLFFLSLFMMKVVCQEIYREIQSNRLLRSGLKNIKVATITEHHKEFLILPAPLQIQLLKR